MSAIKFVLGTAFILSSISASFAATCDDQARASGDPSGDELIAFLSFDEKISNFCSEDVKGETSGSMSYSNLKISFERSDSSNSTLGHCTEAFEDIISQCIKPSSPGTYGGSSSFDNGETYAIIKELYPQEPIVSANLENREVEMSNKKPAKAIHKATHKTAPKANSKTKETPATTSPEITQTAPKSTKLPKPTTQSIPTTHKSSIAKTSSPPETPKITPTSTNSKAMETALTILESTNSNSISSKTPLSSLSWTKTSTKESPTSTDSVSKASVPASSKSSSYPTKSSMGESSIDTHSVLTSGVSSSKTSVNSPPVTPTESTSIKSSAVSSNTQEPASRINSSSAGSSVKPSSVVYSDSSSKLATPALEVSSHIGESSSTHPISDSVESTAAKTSLDTSASATDIHTSSVPSSALSSGALSSRTQSSGSSSMKPSSSSAHTFEPTPAPTEAPVPATSPEKTGSLLSEINAVSKPSSVSSSMPEVTTGPSVISSLVLTSSYIVEPSNPIDKSSNSKGSNVVHASSITSAVSSESLTSSMQPGITRPPLTSSNLASGAVPLASESEPTSHTTSTGSLTDPAQSEITPSPLDPSASDTITSTSGPGFLSQALSIGSLAFSVATKLAPSPSNLPASETVTSSPSEETDPSETSQPETTESSPTDLALISPTLTSSPTCSVTTGGNCSACYQYSGSGDVSSSNDTTLTARDLPPSIAGRISTSHLSPKLSKRVARSFTSFDAANSCVFSAIEIPSIPDPSNLVGKAGPQTQYWYVLQDTSINATTCPVLGFTKVTDGALASHLISPNAIGYTKAAPGISWKVDAPTVDVDSVYEPLILQEFFASKVTSNNCASFKAVFDRPDADNGGKTRLQNVWNQLPSDINPNFAGIDQKISTIKAQAFQGDSQHTSSSNDEKLAYISELAVAMAITNNDDIASIFKSTNLRIYQALIGIDAVIEAANATTTSLIKPDWASTYRTYLANLLSTRSSAINAQVSSYLNNDLGPAVRSDNVTLPDGTVSTTENSIGKGVDAFLKAYPMPDSFTFDQEKLLGFPGA
ncbi:hypothetical protein MFRU_014g00750 [Monilinia fructicola]|nr:hypothetical protein MFRU_014g00750 [Monilinia fructicola]